MPVTCLAGRKPRTVRWIRQFVALWGLLRRAGGLGLPALAFVGAAGAVELLLLTALPFVNGRVIDALAVADINGIRTWLIVAIGLSVSFAAVNLWHGLAALRLTEEVGHALRLSTTRSALGRSVRDVDTNSVGDVITRTLGDTAILKGTAVGVILQAVYDLVAVALMFGILMFVHPLLAVLVCGLVPLSVALRAGTGSKIAQRHEAARDTASGVTDEIWGWLVAPQEVHAYHITPHALRSIGAASRKAGDASVSAGGLVAWVSAAASFLLQLPTLAILSIGSFAVVRGDLSIGTLFAFIAFAAYFQAPIQRFLAMVLTGLPSLEPVVTRVSQLVDIPSHGDDDLLPHSSATAPTALSLAACNVVIVRPPALSLSVQRFDARPGELVGVVGRNGSGKSTFLKLLAGLDRPDQGEIGIRFHDEVMSPRRQLISFAPPQTRLLRGSLLENVTMFSTEIDFARLEECAIALGFDRVVGRLPEGWQTPLVPGILGVFSQGELRQLGVLRALYRSGPILILDEPTDSLDSSARSLMIDALARRRKEAVVVVATQDRALIDACDRTVSLSDAVATSAPGDEASVNQVQSV